MVAVRCGCRQVIDLVVDMRMWQDVFLATKPELNSIAQLGTFCRDIGMPLDAPDNCEAELPFFIMNITDEGDEGYVYMQHTSMWDYSRGSGGGKSDCARLLLRVLMQPLFAFRRVADYCRGHLQKSTRALGCRAAKSRVVSPMFCTICRRISLQSRST